ncbi:MAG: hypothetical protein ABSE72_02570 [Bacteroidales bacterium]|jgi:hypothetical protein
MNIKEKTLFSLKFRNGLLFGVIINVLLVVYGELLVPTAITASSNGVSGFITSLSILLVYAGVSFYCIKPTERVFHNILQYSLIFGLIIGSIYFLEIILEYILLPSGQLNIIMGKIEFGLALFLFFLSGLWSVVATQKYFSSILTSFWCGIVASLIWLCAVLLVFYLFHGTSQQITVLKAEGDYEDFKRSGMTDFNAFIVQDFWGAGFFHLLLSPIIASILGSIGGLFGFLFLKLFKHNR